MAFNGFKQLLTCIECGCEDSRACINAITRQPCYWVVEDRKNGLGVCSECLGKWQNNLRQQGIKYARDWLIATYLHGFLDKPEADVRDFARSLDGAAAELADNTTDDWVNSTFGDEWLNKPESSQANISSSGSAFDAIKHLNNEMWRWTSRMSYNGSYVGEPEGLLKKNIREIEHILSAAIGSPFIPGELKQTEPQNIPENISEIEKITLVISFEKGSAPAVHAGMNILGGRLSSVAWRDALEPQWNPVSKEPPKNQHVLIATDDDWVDVDYCDILNGWSDYEGSVTHWMEFPDPPARSFS